MACLNYYVIDEHGRRHKHEAYKPFKIFNYPKYDLHDLKEKEIWIKENKGSASLYRYISDYAAKLIELGRNKEALPILKKINSKYPDEYIISSNLGVAYELNGELDSALKYLKKSYKKNPNSHFNSEWFHIRFLEAAILHRNTGVNIEDINILNIDTCTDLKIGEQISRQLHERIPLSSAPNNLLAKALEETADYYFRAVSVHWSAKLYAMAIGYTSNDEHKKNLWGKIEYARKKALEIDKKKRTDNSYIHMKKRDDTINYVIKPNWKKKVEADIKKWENNKAHYEKDLIIMDL